MPIDAFYEDRHTSERFPQEPMTRADLMEAIRKATDTRLRLAVLEDRYNRVHTAGYTPNAVREDAREIIEDGIENFETRRLPFIQREAHRLGVESLVGVVIYRLNQVVQNPDAPIAPLRQSLSRLQSVS